MTRRTRRIAFVNEKGGSCKTTLAVNLGAYHAMYRRKRVLLVDLDSQGHVGKSLGFDVRAAPVSTYDWLTDPGVTLNQAIQPSRIEGLDVVCANKSLSDFTVRVAGDKDRERKLQHKLAAADGLYDFVILDTPPSLGLITLNVMLATNEIVVPVSLTYFALDGCAEILDTVEQVKTEYARDGLGVTLIVPTLYRNTNMARDIIDKLKTYFPRQLARNILGFNVKIDEAQSHGRTIWEYAPSSSGARVLEALALEVQHRDPGRPR